MSESDVSSFLSCQFYLFGNVREAVEKAGDREILRVFQPFFYLYAIVTESSVRYLFFSLEIRIQRLNFAFNDLYEAVFDPSNVESLPEAMR